MQRTKAELPTKRDQVLNGAIGLCGEAGEVLEVVKKFYFQHYRYFNDKPLQAEIDCIATELGDVLFYYCLLVAELGLNLEDIVEKNIRKREERYPHGFDRMASMERGK